MAHAVLSSQAVHIIANISAPKNFCCTSLQFVGRCARIFLQSGVGEDSGSYHVGIPLTSLPSLSMDCITSISSSFGIWISTERRAASSSSASIVPPPLLSNRSKTSLKAKTGTEESYQWINSLISCQMGKLWAVLITRIESVSYQ